MNCNLIKRIPGKFYSTSRSYNKEKVYICIYISKIKLYVVILNNFLKRNAVDILILIKKKINKVYNYDFYTVECNDDVLLDCGFNN